MTTPDNTATTSPYLAPDNPADPEAAALDLIVRLPADTLSGPSGCALAPTASRGMTRPRWCGRSPSQRSCSGYEHRVTDPNIPCRMRFLTPT
jgi:hypothetical protein